MRQIKLAIPSAFERTLIYRTVSYRLVRTRVYTVQPLHSPHFIIFNILKLKIFEMELSHGRTRRERSMLNRNTEADETCLDEFNQLQTAR